MLRSITKRHKPVVRPAFLLNKFMTYKQLLDYLQELDEEQLEFDVCALVDEEFFPVVDLHVCNSKEDDRLDDSHPYLEVQ